MPSSFLAQRLPKLLHRHLCAAILTSHDPFWKQLTINRLTMRKDLHVAHVFYTFFGKWEQAKYERLLAQKLPLLKQLVSRKWPLKRLPQLIFVLDQTGLKQERVWTVLHS